MICIYRDQEDANGRIRGCFNPRLNGPTFFNAVIFMLIVLSLTCMIPACAVESAAALNEEGSALLAAGQPVQALAVFDRGIALDPSYTPLRVNRGLALIELGRPDDALLSFDIAIDQEPYSPDAWIYRGDAYAAKQDYPDAVESYNMALELDPDLVSVWEQKGDTLLLSGDTQGARESYSAGLEIDPGNADLQQKLADLPASFLDTSNLLIVAGIACVVLILIVVVYTRRSNKTDGSTHPPDAGKKRPTFLSGRKNADTDSLPAIEDEIPGFLSKIKGDSGTEENPAGLFGVFSKNKAKNAATRTTGAPGEQPHVIESDTPKTRKKPSILSFGKKKAEDLSKEDADEVRDALLMDGEEIFHFDEGSGVGTAGNEGRLVGGFDRMLEQNPDLSAGFRGITLYSLGQYREALEDFDRELAQDPGAVGIWILRAQVLARLGKDQDSLYSCEQALGIEKDNFDAWRQYGFTLRKLGRDREALHALDRALSLNPHSAEVWAARGRILHDLSRDHEALQSYDRALGIDPRSSNLWLMRARSLSELGREEEALDSLEQGISANPENPSLYIWQGRLFHTLGRLGNALTAYDRALTLRPDDARTWEAMGAVLHELEKYRDEAAAYDRAIAIDTENPSLYLKRGDALVAGGKMEDAVSDYRKALALRPYDMNVIQRLGDLLCRTGRHQEGKEVLRPLLEADSDGFEMKKLKGAAFLSLGEFRRALESFENVLSRDPDDIVAREGAETAEAALAAGHLDTREGRAVSTSHRSPMGDEKEYPGRGDIA
jgi:tetratricopeptide (TPR) repeat protein